MNITTPRLYFKKFSELNINEKQSVVDCWENVFCKRYNNIKNPKETVEKLAKLQEPKFDDVKDWWDTNFFRVAFLKENNQFIGTFRFGIWYEKHDPKIWNYGLMFVDLKHWNKGFSSEIIRGIIECLKQNATDLIGEADCQNYASYKTMIKNGFEWFDLDDDGDYRYKLDLTKPPKTNEEIQKTWQKHIDMTIKDFGLKKVNKLQLIDTKIKEMIKRINNGENQKKLIEEYLKKIDSIQNLNFN